MTELSSYVRRVDIYRGVFGMAVWYVDEVDGDRHIRLRGHAGSLKQRW